MYAQDAISKASYDDDKNRKAQVVDLQRAGGFGFFSLRNGITSKDMANMGKNPFCAYAVFLMVFFACYSLGGGRLSKTTYEDKLGYTSCILEALGLISLQYKVSCRGHVNGLSGMSMVMLTLSYTMREYETFGAAKVPWITIDGMCIELLQMVTCALVYVNLWSIFKTYRNSYQEDLDVLKVKYLIPGCLLLGLLLHPVFRQGWKYSLSWAMSFYIDVLALLPQVVMMQRGDGKVYAPIAHFVAATAFSRFNDLCFWIVRWERSKVLPQGMEIIVGFHVINLLLVADFMYYYIKAWLQGRRTSSKDKDIMFELEVLEV
jgi:hypothetical protein